jgi:hypothetical protein
LLFLTPALASANFSTGVLFGGFGAYSVSGGDRQSYTGGVEAHVDYAPLPEFSLGFGVPVTINAPGPTSDGYDVGFGPRFQLVWPTTSWIQPFLLFSPAIAYSSLPTKVWWSGWALREMAGVSLRAGATLRVLFCLGLEQTRFEGDTPTFVGGPGNGPIVHGIVRTNYVTFNTGLDFAF